MRLKTQFITTMLLFGIILVVVAASAILTDRQMEKTGQRERIAAHIAQGASELSYLANDYLIYRESQQLKRWQSRFAAFSAEVAALHVDRPEQQTLAANLKANQLRLKEVFASVLSTVEDYSQNRGTAPGLSFLQISWSRVAVQSQGLASDASQLSMLLHQQMDQLTKTGDLLLYVVLGLLGIFLFATYMLTYRRILKSIMTLRAGTAVIGSGNLDFIIEEKRSDEIGDLSQAFNRMTSELKRVTASKADLEREMAERERAEKALRESEARYRNLVKYAPAGIYEVDFATGRFTEVNDVMCQILGYSRDEILAITPFEILEPEGRAHFASRISNAQSGEQPEEVVEYRVRTKDGRLIWALLNVTFHWNGGRIVRATVVSYDITERRQMEEELRQSRDELELRVQERTAELARTSELLRDLSSKLLSTQEDERKKIAGEIHDTLGAGLAAIKFKVEHVQQQMSKVSGAATESLDILIPLIQENIDVCRRIQQDLRPSMLDDLGLLPTLSWFCRRYQTIFTGIAVKLEQTLEEKDLPDSLKIVIFRVTQEGMNNIAKHSQADLVHLSLGKTDGRIELVLQDNGQGFDLKKVLGMESTKRGLGLTSMRERTELSGGSFIIESAEGKGTVIRAVWPV